MSYWEKLIEKYADGRPICNCRMAYRSKGGKYWKGGKEFNDGLFCKHGCAANIYAVKEFIAEQVLADQS